MKCLILFTATIHWDDDDDDDDDDVGVGVGVVLVVVRGQPSICAHLFIVSLDNLRQPIIFCMSERYDFTWSTVNG